MTEPAVPGWVLVEDVDVRNAGSWTAIMAAPLDDDAQHRPLELEQSGGEAT